MVTDIEPDPLAYADWTDRRGAAEFAAHQTWIKLHDGQHCSAPVQIPGKPKFCLTQALCYMPGRGPRCARHASE